MSRTAMYYRSARSASPVSIRPLTPMVYDVPHSLEAPQREHLKLRARNPRVRRRNSSCSMQALTPQMLHGRPAFQPVVCCINLDHDPVRCCDAPRPHQLLCHAACRRSVPPGRLHRRRALRGWVWPLL
eukprot:scaffold40300_cov270-Isochrysis_galbana.AAC.4